MDEEKIICRCEEVTEKEIMQAIEGGARSLDEVKKRTRAGMGYCQGKTCKKLIARMLSSYTGEPMEKFLPGSIRMPVGPVSLSVLAASEEAAKEGTK